MADHTLPQMPSLIGYSSTRALRSPQQQVPYRGDDAGFRVTGCPPAVVLLMLCHAPLNQGHQDFSGGCFFTAYSAGVISISSSFFLLLILQYSGTLCSFPTFERNALRVTKPKFFSKFRRTFLTRRSFQTFQDETLETNGRRLLPSSK